MGKFKRIDATAKSLWTSSNNTKAAWERLPDCRCDEWKAKYKEMELDRNLEHNKYVRAKKLLDNIDKITKFSSSGVAREIHILFLKAGLDVD